MLNLNQSPEELNRIHTENYYWYLQSPEFRARFLHPIGAYFLPRLGNSYLDVCCGEGWLADYIPFGEGVKPFYRGIDGSEIAIQKAIQRYRKTGKYTTFRVERMETPVFDRSFDVIVFGNLFAVLIDPMRQLDFIQMYVNGYRAKYFIVYDLQTLDTSIIDRYFRRVWYLEGSVELPNVQDIKKHRKVIVYSCT